MFKSRAGVLSAIVSLVFVLAGCGSTMNTQILRQQLSPALDSGFAMTTNAVTSITFKDASGAVGDNCGSSKSKCAAMKREAGLGKWKLIKRTFSKYGHDHVELITTPPGKYLLVGFDIVNSGTAGATTGYYFKNNDDMPVIEVKPHEVMLVGELTHMRSKTGSMGGGHKLIATPDAKRRIVEIVKYELNERTDNDAEEMALYKSWLPALEKATANIQ